MYYVQDVPVQYVRLSKAIRVLCLFPAIWGVYTHIAQAHSAEKRIARALDPTISSALDNYVGVLWCLLSGLWSYWLTNSLIHRWFIHYDPRSAMIRLFTLGTFFWFSVVFFVSYFGSDEPIWPWMVICAILAVIQTIQILRFRVKGHPKLDTKFKPRRDAKTLIYKTILIPGGIVSFMTMVILLHQNNIRPSTAEVLATGGAANLSPTNNAKLNIGSAQVQVLIIIFSSWAPKALQRRQEIRDTTLKLAPPYSSKFAYTYKFILGEAPNSHARNTMGAKINEEIRKHDDILQLSFLDGADRKGYRVFKALEWSNRFKFDYLCKTDDDVFVRWDTIANELAAQGPSHYYWKGLAFRDMETVPNSDQNTINEFDNPRIQPPFVSSTFYIFSRDIVTLLTYPGPRIFTENEDQDIGIWLHSFSIKPQHDRRIQQWDVCENDLIAKRFGESFKPLESMQEMLKNIVGKRPLCHGFRQNHCALCYSCYGRGIHWKDRGLDCDSVQGISHIKETRDIEGGLTVDIKDTMPPLGMNPEWIIPNVLSDKSSIYSDTGEWSQLYWAIWTTEPDTTWKHRHYQVIESVFVHNPDATLIIMSNTLPNDFFREYTRQGFKIHVMRFTKELLLRQEWYFDSETQDWLRKWEEWSRDGDFFHVHLADYLRIVALYKYGGLYMDMDAVWIRAPGDRNTEFIGSDISDTESDLSWTLDAKNTYIPNGVMRFKRGRSMLRQIARTFFTPSNYNPKCFNCGGPKAFTVYIKTHKTSLEKNGLNILPPTALYPYNWKEISAALQKTDKPEEEILRLENHGIGLHLYGKVTSRKDIEEGSIVGTVFKTWSLDLSPSEPQTHAKGPKLQGPKTLYYNTPGASPKNSLLDILPGEFKGRDSVFIRGSSSYNDESVTQKASLLISAKEGLIAMGATSIGSRKLQIDLGAAVTMAQINSALSHLRYIPSSTPKWGGTDQLVIQVEFGALREQLDISVVLRSN
ncbi:hypothetical protein BGZ76_001896 [Entomortierella beljakovae]|nr:hypothetical protein BGZ76_001896 [Entomortierella beljakovae]